jgi:hypothetical protein
MDSTPSLKANACMVVIEDSNPNQFTKDQCLAKFEDLQFAVEKPVDFESLMVNGFPTIKELFERQGLMYYFDIVNGPTYTELVKEFWMKAHVITRKSYTEVVEKMKKEKPELREKSPADMGLRPFLGLEVESVVAGLKIYIRMEHIYEALKLSSGGLILKGDDTVGSDVQDFLYEKDSQSKSNTNLTKINKILYKIFIDSIVPKL